jgi:hypothetical protein
LSDAGVPDVAGDWFAAMRRGDWEQAWRATDRIELPRREQQKQAGFQRRPGHLRWDGTPLAGRAVLVRCEHGLGDTLQFMRFLPRLGARQLHFMVQPQLVELLRGAPGLGEVRNYWTDDPLPAHEVDIEVMELAYATRTTPASLPPPYPHLRGQLRGVPKLLEENEDRRLRVGLLWAASDWDPTRSIPLGALAPLFDFDGVEFFSLQQGKAGLAAELEPLGIHSLASRTEAVVQAAAAMCELDLVISIDGMPAHLSATLGRPTWILLKQPADWRWMDGREDTPWYPSVRLFRQPREGDWSGLAQAVAVALRDIVGRRPKRPLRPALLGH